MNMDNNNGFNIEKPIAGFEKRRVVGMHTEVTLTKTENVVAWVVFLLAFASFGVGFYLLGKNTTLGVVLMILPFVVIAAMSAFILLRPKHKEERIANTVKYYGTVDRGFNNITGQSYDNSHIEYKQGNVQNVPQLSQNLYGNQTINTQQQYIQQPMPNQQYYNQQPAQNYQYNPQNYHNNFNQNS